MVTQLIKPKVKANTLTEVQYSSIKFSLWLGDISVQSKMTPLDVDTSFKNNFLFHITAAFLSYCPLSQATSHGARWGR